MFFEELNCFDSDVYAACERELNRQKHNIELIASENIVSKAVLLAAPSLISGKSSLVQKTEAKMFSRTSLRQLLQR